MPGVVSSKAMLRSWQLVSSGKNKNIHSTTQAILGYGSIRSRSRAYATISSSWGLPQTMVNDLKHQEILVAFNDKHTTRFPSFWLRDNCPCPVCRHPHTQQRQIDTFSVDPDIKATSAEPSSDGLHVTWSQDGHQSLFPWEYLQEHTPLSTAPSTKHPRQSWYHMVPTSGPTNIQTNYSSIISSKPGLRQFLSQILTYGYSLISDTPKTPEATEKLLNRISHIRATQYGAFWDFTTSAKPTDTAYTNLSLPLHTDTTYFTDPAGLQLFHCLQPATISGGQSTFSDGFAAAAALHKLNPDYYNILSSIPVVSHASGNSESGTFTNASVHSSGYPVLSHAVPYTRPHPSNLTQIRWNNDDRHSMTQWPSHERMIMWYRAAREFSRLLASPEYQWQTQLEPGMPIIFDNWRILHGRRAYEGQRRICGGYIGMDEFLARCRSAGIEKAGFVTADSGEEVSGHEESETEQERQNREKVEREQVEEKKEQEEQKDGNLEPDVMPQREEGGVRQPYAS